DTAQYKRESDWGENMNLVVWRDKQWPYASMQGAFALTSVTYSSKTGRIADADVEINSDDYDFTSFSSSRAGKTNKVDIANTLTHEVGHFLGLDHAAKEAATMYRSAPPGEVKKRTLHQDDINGLCAIYPGNDRVNSCEYPKDFKPPPPSDGNGDDSSCSSVGGGPFPQGALVIGFSLLVLLRLRCRD
ncbi:MAG: matrixin family metalloprotease, partial [Bradymonadaceae bacterium]